ncbi:Transcriptional regulatory protein PhoP [Jannaschia seosinensis]|uniref:Transcriptional regulatory protein PhoP n=1 Tax=Jannaschia seosinensis TaxID=313367 RepID=A0A0M7B9W0_9RHOB|nr:response regulator [Jannaschia seosinensis]CUH39161.1 Transcriptional regulatory protein PhoP [Jannaschia seosinensis]
MPNSDSTRTDIAKPTDFALRPAPTPQRPLLGQTVLLVEDSRYASEAIRLLSLRSGARIRRADCIASAERHLLTYRAGVAIVDLGLPDGSGLELIARLANATQRPDVILATSGQAADVVEEDALAAGADGFLPKPVESLESFQQLILRHLPSALWPRGLRIVGSETIEPDTLALTEDLIRAERMAEEASATPAFIANFLAGLARTGRDPALLAEAEGLASRTLDDIRPALRRMIEARRETKSAI